MANNPSESSWINYLDETVETYVESNLQTQVTTGFNGVISDAQNNRFVLPDGNRLLYSSNRVRQQPIAGSGSVVTFGASFQRTTTSGALGFAIYTDGQVNSRDFQNGYLALFGSDANVHIYQITNGLWKIVSDPTYNVPYPLDLHEHNFSIAIVSPAAGQLQIYVYSDTAVFAAANLTPPFFRNGTMGFCSIQGNGAVFLTPGSFNYTSGQTLAQVLPPAVVSSINSIEGSFDGTGVLTAQHIDFQKYTYQNQIIDYIYDGSTYQRMPKTNMDSNRRALIDFNQSGHLNAEIPRKNLIINGNCSFGTGTINPGLYGWTNAYSSPAGTGPLSISANGNYGPYTSIQITKSASGTTQGYYQNVPVNGGQNYTFQILFFSSSSTLQPQIWIGSNDLSTQYNATLVSPINSATIPAFYSGGSASSLANSTTGIPNKWVFLFGTFAIPSGVKSVSVGLFDISTSTSTPFYCNGVMLVEGNRIQDYIDHEPNLNAISNAHFSPAATQDGLADGYFYRRPYNLPHQGSNLIENPYFSVGPVNPSTEIAANWSNIPTVNLATNQFWHSFQELNNGQAYTGNADACSSINVVSGAAIIPALTVFSNRIVTERPFPVRVGDTVVMNAYMSLSGSALPAGTQYHLRTGFYAQYSDGSSTPINSALGAVNVVSQVTLNGGYQLVQSSYTVAAPTGSVSILGLTVGIYVDVQNNTASPIDVSSSALVFRVGIVQVYRQTNLASEVSGLLPATQLSGNIPYANESTDVQAAIYPGGILQGINTVGLLYWNPVAAYTTTSSTANLDSVNITIPGVSTSLFTLEIEAVVPTKSASIAINITPPTGWSNIINIPSGTTTNTTQVNQVAKYMAYKVSGGQSFLASLSVTTGTTAGAQSFAGVWTIKIYRYS